MAFPYDSLLFKAIFNDYQQIKLCHSMGALDRINHIQRSDGVSHVFQTFSSISCIVDDIVDIIFYLEQWCTHKQI